MGSIENSLKTFKSSFEYLIQSSVDTYQYITRGSIFANKPSWVVETEKFSSFFQKISENEEMMSNLRKKLVLPFYEEHCLEVLRPIIKEDSTLDDSFLKLPKEEDSGDSFKVRTHPKGLYFQISKVFLPLSESYTEAVRISIERKNESPPYPIKILLGFYAVIFHTLKDTNQSDELEHISQNVMKLKDSLESYEDSKKDNQRSQGGPMGMIKNLLGNIDFDQIGEMMKKVSGDEQSSKEFGEVFGKITNVIKDGGNPLEAMGDLIKDATVKAAEEGDPAEENGAMESETVVEGDSVEEASLQQ